MPFGAANSAFWFYGRLLPAHHVPPFSVQSLEIHEGVHFEVAFDGLGLWARPGGTEFKQFGEATAFFRLVVAAYALLSRESLDFTVEGWVEASEAQLGESTLGFFVNRPNAAGMVDPDSNESQAMREAARIATEVRTHANYRLAVRDIYTALGDKTDDAFLFAYRAIEDVARAITGQDEQLTGANWAAFHESRGVAPAEGQQEMEPLTIARRRHMVVREARSFSTPACTGTSWSTWRAPWSSRRSSTPTASMSAKTCSSDSPEQPNAGLSPPTSRWPKREALGARVGGRTSPRRSSRRRALG